MAEAHVTVFAGNRQVLIDADAAHLFERLTWRYAQRTRKWYVVSATSKQGKTVHMYLHRVVMNALPGQVCDHINGDTLDNRRCNLRIVTLQQNAFNAAKKPSKHGNRFRGISTRAHGYGSQIRANGKIMHLGTFRTDVEAAYAYDVASLQHHGEHGRRNFLPLVT